MKAKMLILTHFSPRYEAVGGKDQIAVEDLQNEAAAVSNCPVVTMKLIHEK